MVSNKAQTRLKKEKRKKMRSINFLCLLFVLIILTLLACSPKKSKNSPKKITIATAANMQFAMEALTDQFSKKTDIDCDLIISSSGKLTAQIKEGAPFDIFVAANMKYPQEIFDNGLAQAPPKIYAYGKLVLWSMVKDLTPSVESLSDPSIRHIALANPKIAPYGVAAKEVLAYYKLFEKVKNKLVYGESIAQTNQFITTQSAELGFTAMSVALSPKVKGKGQWVSLADSTYHPIKQGVVIINREKNYQDNTQKFYEFLFSKEAKQILQTFGYIVEE